MLYKLKFLPDDGARFTGIVTVLCSVTYTDANDNEGPELQTNTRKKDKFAIIFNRTEAE